MNADRVLQVVRFSAVVVVLFPVRSNLAVYVRPAVVNGVRTAGDACFSEGYPELVRRRKMREEKEHTTPGGDASTISVALRSEPGTCDLP